MREPVQVSPACHFVTGSFSASDPYIVEQFNRGCTKSSNKKAQLHFCASEQNNLKKTAAEGVPNAAVWCYSVTAMTQNNIVIYSTPIQLKFPVNLERIIKISDPVYAFNEVVSHIDPNQYFAPIRAQNLRLFRNTALSG